MKAEILSPWIGTGSIADPNRPRVADDHPLISWTDTTGQPAQNLTPVPNLFVIEVEATAALITAIEADPNYEVLWSE